MGGVSVSSSDEDSSSGNVYVERLPEILNFPRPAVPSESEDDNTSDENELDNGLFSTSLDLNYRHKMASRVYEELLKSYDDSRVCCQGLKAARSRIMSYKPGTWIQMADDTKLCDYDVPKMTTLLLVGPKGSGKSSLVNKIFRCFDDDEFASDRAQVSYYAYNGEGTCFLKEYIIARGSNSFCLFDTRSFASGLSDNTEMIKRWMTEGVCDGEPVTRNSDGSSVRARIMNKARQNNFNSSRIRKVNFVIYVVNGVSVLKSMDSDEVAGRQYNKLIASTFNCPYLSYKDYKAAVVVSHGDLLSLSERASVRAHLGELLNIPPVTQTFDIPDIVHPSTDLAILDMLRYSLEHSDRNISCRPKWWGKVTNSLFIYMLLSSMVVIVFSVVFLRGALNLRDLESEPQINWHDIKHIW